MYTEITYVVIPAYEPDEKMLITINELTRKTDYKILVINDGSSNEKSKLFIEASKNATVICHEKNKGKGAAIKTALKCINNKSVDATIVIADADGQHKINDIIRVAEESRSNKDKLVLGCREFTGKIPWKSKFGNSITKSVFRFVTGMKVSDTQTGLRGFSSQLIPFLLNIKGERYEYEMNTLLECSREGISIFEVPIETVYIDDNSCSHFNPVKDSFIIYKDIIKFSISSITSFLVDYAFYSILFIMTSSLVLSNVTARTVSSIFNFSVNRKYVFGQKDHLASSAVKYFLLCAFILVANTTLLKILTLYLIKNVYIAKILTEMILFIISWTIQKQFVFKKEVKAIWRKINNYRFTDLL